jgi:hypothetical protein
MNFLSAGLTNILNFKKPKYEEAKMITITNIVLLIIAPLHLFFLWLEMFLWQKPLGLKTFRQTREQAHAVN